MRKLERPEAVKILHRIKMVYQNFILNQEVIDLWTEYLMRADAEMVVYNTDEYLQHEKFPPTISDLVKQNENVLARREKEETRLRIAEHDRLALETSRPPWEKEGISHRDWIHREIDRHRAARKERES